MIAPFKLERFFERHEFSVRHLACASDPESMRIADLLALEPGAADAFAQVGLGYIDARGTPALRQAISALYTATPVERILAHAGAEEPIFAFMHTELEAGDHLIVHAPTYQSLAEVARSRQVSVSDWRVHESNRWQLDPDELPRLVNARTKGLVFNSPHNPTGTLMTRDRFDAIVKFARERGLFIFSDEVYRGLEHDPSQRNPAMCDVYERGLSIGALAKTYGLAGLRVGWAASPMRDVIDRMSAFKDYLTICNAGPSEFLAALALRHAEQLAARSRALVTSNLPHFQALVDAYPERLSWVRPTSGTTAFPRYMGSASALSEGLLRDTGVLVLPGPLFDAGDAHFRLGLGRAGFAEVMQLVSGWLATH